MVITLNLLRKYIKWEKTRYSLLRHVSNCWCEFAIFFSYHRRMKIKDHDATLNRYYIFCQSSQLTLHTFSLPLRWKDTSSYVQCPFPHSFFNLGKPSFINLKYVFASTLPCNAKEKLKVSVLRTYRYNIQRWWHDKIFVTLSINEGLH